jgi:O-antigen/teichoic acid export membrane protein
MAVSRLDRGKRIMSSEAEPVRVPISKRLVLINSASMIATRVLAVGVFAWVIQYLMKRIPEAELALLPIVLSLALILPLLQTVLTSGLSRFVTEAYARNDLAGVTRIVSSQLPLLLVGAIALTLVGGTVAWYINVILDIPPSMLGKARLMMLLIVARMAIGMVLAPFNTGLHASQRFVVQNGIDITSTVIRIALMIGLILGIGPNVVWVIVASVVSQLFGLLTSTVISMRLLPALRFRLASVDWAVAKNVIAFGGWNFVTESANLIRRAADAPLLNVFATPVAVNDFFLGSLFETQLRQMAVTAIQPLLPALTAMHAHRQHARLAAAFLRGGRLALWASMFLAVPLIIFSHDLFALYLRGSYAEHTDAAVVMILLLLGFPLTYPTMVYLRIAYAQGDIRRVSITSFVGQLGNLMLTLLLVGVFHMGAVGSAAATLITFAIVYPFFFWPLAVHTLQISWPKFFTELLLPGLIPALVAASVGVLVFPLTGPSSLARVALGVPLCLAAYAISLLFALQPVDRADLLRIRKAVWK